MIEADDRLPSYALIADQLRAQIDAGELRPGAMLPSVVRLAQIHRVSRPTARQAVAELERAGLVRVDARRGAFVRYRFAVRQLVLPPCVVRWRPPTRAEARRFGLGPAVGVVVIERDGRRPVVLPADRVEIKIISDLGQK